MTIQEKTKDSLQQAYLIVARERAESLNTLPPEVINLLEVKDGKMTVKGDQGRTPEIEAKAINHKTKVQAVAGDVEYKTL